MGKSSEKVELNHFYQGKGSFLQRILVRKIVNNIPQARVMPKMQRSQLVIRTIAPVYRKNYTGKIQLFSFRQNEIIFGNFQPSWELNESMKTKKFMKSWIGATKNSKRMKETRKIQRFCYFPIKFVFSAKFSAGGSFFAKEVLHGTISKLSLRSHQHCYLIGFRFYNGLLDWNI